MLEVIEIPTTVNSDPLAVKLLKRMLNSSSGLIEPVLVPSSEFGYTYPEVENYLRVSTMESISLLEALSIEDIFEKRLFGTFLSCPECGSSQLVSINGCPRCGLDKITRGRILEHFYCGNIGLEEDFIILGKYICPKCKNEVKYLGTDYRSLGVKYSCYNCGNIFDESVPLRRCSNCLKLFFEKDAKETAMYSFHLSEEKKFHLNFDFGLKQQLKSFLKERGYSVSEKAKISGVSKSGKEHIFDLIARRFDGLLEYVLCIDFIIKTNNQHVSLDDVFKFDNKAYDVGVHDKILVAIPDLSEKAIKFASKQRIKALTTADLEEIIKMPVRFENIASDDKESTFRSRNDLIAYLSKHGYTVQEKAMVRGRSGVEHLIDILAGIDDGIISHTVDIGILDQGSDINIDQILLFDTRAYDIGAHDKVLFIPKGRRFEEDVQQFAQQQKIKLFEFAVKG